MDANQAASSFRDGSLMQMEENREKLKIKTIRRKELSQKID